MKDYLGHKYFCDDDGLWKVVKDDTIFIVALDDAKIDSNRTFDASKNNELTCKKYIYWLVN